MQDLLVLTAGQPEIEVGPGDVVVAQGDEPRHLYVLVTGRLMVQRDGEDFIAIDAPGACVGEMAVLLGRTHTASVIATEPSRLRVISDAHAALDEDPPVLHAVATLLARRLDLVNRYLADLQHQYRDHDGGLGLIGDVLRTLATHHGDELEPGSDREPDPLY
jgi:CRP/FNR family transcriptional regulator, cyclic AMP receptor protein